MIPENALIWGNIPGKHNCGACPVNDKDPNHVTECKIFNVHLEYYMDGPPWADFRCLECKSKLPNGGTLVIIPN